MKQFDSEKFNEETKHTQQIVAEQKQQKYNDAKVTQKHKETIKKIELIQQQLKK
jgi:hypothetical protein